MGGCSGTPTLPYPRQDESRAGEKECRIRKMECEVKRILERSFFMAMIPPTITQQEHRLATRVVRGRTVPVMYEPPELKAARRKLLDHVARFRPEEPAAGPVQLITKWIWEFPDLPKAPGIDESYMEYKTTKPDTDNLIKMLKDCMTQAGFWKDDAQVASEITEKFFGFVPGIYVRITELPRGNER